MAGNCAHCGASGTCKTGKDGASCARCQKKSNTEEKMGLPCSVCWGTGDTAKGWIWDLAIKPILAAVIVAVSLIIAAYVAFTDPTQRGAIIAFVGTLTGSVTAFYFSSRRTTDNGRGSTV